MKKQKRYYSAQSAAGSATSYGFANDWLVLVWESKAARDAYLSWVGNLSAIAIRRSEATKKATNWCCTQNRLLAPRTFLGEFWCIRFPDSESGPDGLVGVLDVCDFEDDNLERFYK